MRKIYLFKCFEKAILRKYPLAVVEYYKDINLFDFIIISFENLNSKKQYYYDNLDDLCKFKSLNTKSVIAIYEGLESIESHKNDYLGVT